MERKGKLESRRRAERVERGEEEVRTLQIKVKAVFRALEVAAKCINARGVGVAVVMIGQLCSPQVAAYLTLEADSLTIPVSFTIKFHNKNWVVTHWRVLHHSLGTVALGSNSWWVNCGGKCELTPPFTVLIEIAPRLETDPDVNTWDPQAWGSVLCFPTRLAGPLSNLFLQFLLYNAKIIIVTSLTRITSKDY